MQKLNIDIEKLKKYLKEGKNDSEIARILNINNVTVRNYRIKLGIKKSNFKYTSKVNKKNFLQLYKQNKSDREIGKILNIHYSTIQSFRKTLKLEPIKKYDKIKLTNFEKEALLGCILGDGYLVVNKTKTSARGHIAHSLKQEFYCLHKFKIFKKLVTNNIKYNTLIHSKTKKESKEIRFLFKSNPYLLEIYNLFYINKVKCITEDMLKNFSKVSLAYLFMDDGFKTKNSYSIATNCFSKKDLILFSNFLYKKFNIKTSIFKSNVLFIKQESKSTFEKCIKKYLTKDLFYKLHCSPDKIG